MENGSTNARWGAVLGVHCLLIKNPHLANTVRGKGQIAGAAHMRSRKLVGGKQVEGVGPRAPSLGKGIKWGE
jgi:hypothetical protein